MVYGKGDMLKAHRTRQARVHRQDEKTIKVASWGACVIAATWLSTVLLGLKGMYLSRPRGHESPRCTHTSRCLLSLTVNR